MTTTRPLDDTGSNAATRTLRLPSAKVLIGTAWGICSLALMAWFAAEILFTDHDPYRSEGPVDSILSIGVVSTVALLICVGAGALVRGFPERARVGAVVFGVLSVVTIIFFWSGAPAIFGASAASLAGLTRDGRRLGGAARVAGVVGVCVLALNILLTIGGVLLSAVS